ncbi:hypothetical protein GUITHDRAFT_106472 [Guillardia theta CCMP2712]|uniref:LysM domain-containing protein n=1 Tax=Guillardia theta (strain CCMP2712) TaxID=905079 RepID=L1JIE6_GUITC|nr:hypothetical protein GUITHDRAFT_106472 [Guillardia theta CCMP2712]EKX47924.1 hypothetical protein GUITHDRAFT_106472 [Guillardia theta CCMP2712]|eukprot:XP_005834904.1 hypothetical protein GUITHDRAFT_106472 [Guillardia theta CCMP2712]
MTSSNLSHGIISILLLAVAASAQESGRWRYGAISWKRKFPTNSSSRMVTFTVESAWRLSHGSIVVFGTQNKPSTAGEIMKITGVDGQDPILSFGDGNMTAKFDVEVLRVDPIQDMVVGVTNIDWEYGPGGPWLANLTLCCRVAGNQNANKGVLLTTKVDLSSADMIGSPYVRMMPLVSVRLSEPTVQQFLIPAASARGFAEHDSLSWSMMPASYYNALYNVAPNTTIVQVDAMTGMVSFDVSCFKTTCTDDVEVVFVVQDTQSNSFCTVDVIVHVQRNTQVGPTILLNGPPNTPMQQGEAFSNQTLMPAIVGFEEFPLKLTFSATDPDFTKILYFEFNTLPLGATADAKIGSNPAYRTITWTPLKGRAGDYYICGVALNMDPSSVCTCNPPVSPCIPTCPNHIRTLPTCFHINIKPNAPPSFVLPAMSNASYINIRAVNENVLDPVIITAPVVLPIGASLAPILGDSQAICFRAVNSISDVSSEACVQVAVNRCSWSVNQGQTLAEIATIFGSNFVQPGTSISVGHLYTVRSTDNIRYLNVQFATTRATIELLNFDLKAAISALSQPLGDKDPLAFWSGRQVCILPHSCVDTLGKAA